MSDAVRMSHDIQISALDDRQYESILLENGLQVLLVSDPYSEKSAASMDVHVGHQSDPDDLPGLAHFCEHMLFLGTEKYPDENSYKQFLSAHGGRSNAATSATHTNFYFDVLGEHFLGALDRFAQFFVAPLFTPSATDRERRAVDSEHSKNLQNDHRRLYQLLKSLANPDHAFHKFGTGNIHTLGGDHVRDALLDFHATYYSASIMKLVLYGQEDLTTLKSWAQNLFTSVPTSGRSPPEFGGVLPFDSSRLQTEVRVTPVKDLRVIELAWPTPSLYDEYMSKPSRILSHLLGHEGAGSLLSYLKQQELANGLYAGLVRDHEDWGMFVVNIDATEVGIEKCYDVANAVFQYLAMLQRAAPIEEWMYHEIRDLHATQFRFKSKERPINYVHSLSGNLHKYPKELVIAGPHLMFKYDSQKTQEILKLLVPERVRLTMVSKQFQETTDLAETWYKTPYSYSKLPSDLVSKWQHPDINTALHLPSRNDLICTDFHIVVPSSPFTEVSGEYVLEAPLQVRHDDQCRLWFKADTYFRKPRLSLSFLFYSPMVSPTPRHGVLTSLFVRYLKDELTEWSYDAELAGMDYDISFNSRAIELYVGGFSQKLDKLLDRVLKQLLNMTSPAFQFKENVFDRVKDRTKRLYENFFMEEPYQHTVYSAGLVLDASKWSVEDKVQAIEHMSVQDLALHAQSLLQEVFVEGFCYGNIQEHHAKDLLDGVVSQFAFDAKHEGSWPLLPSQSLRPRIVRLHAGTEYAYRRKDWNDQNKNSALSVLFQVGQETLEKRAALEVLAHVLKEPCFNQLRTQEQLGYIVFSGSMHQEGIEYLRIIVQSTVGDPMYLDSRVESFLLEFRNWILSMPEETWKKQVEAVVQSLVEKPKRESEEYIRLWREIATEMFYFNRRQELATVVRTLHRQDIIDLFDTYISADGKERSKLSIQLYGCEHELVEVQGEKEDVGVAAAVSLTPQASSSVLIKDATAFRRQMPLFPERERPRSSKL